MVGDLLMNIGFDICAAGFVLFPFASIRRLLSNDGDGLNPVRNFFCVWSVSHLVGNDGVYTLFLVSFFLLL
jgi:hypothetical protein